MLAREKSSIASEVLADAARSDLYRTELISFINFQYPSLGELLLVCSKQSKKQIQRRISKTENQNLNYNFIPALFTLFNLKQEKFKQRSESRLFRLPSSMKKFPRKSTGSLRSCRSKFKHLPSEFMRIFEKKNNQFHRSRCRIQKRAEGKTLNACRAAVNEARGGVYRNQIKLFLPFNQHICFMVQLTLSACHSAGRSAGRSLAFMAARFMFDNFMLNILSLTCIIFNVFAANSSPPSCSVERPLCTSGSPVNPFSSRTQRVRGEPLYRSKM